MRPGLIILLILFPLPVFIPALPIFGLFYLWTSQTYPMEEAAMAATVFTIPVYIAAIIVFIAWRKSARAARSSRTTPDYSSEEITDRQRRKRRERARAGGDLAIALALLDGDKKGKR
jgi:TRAP-type uncharacterized transport system fused permease subunit